MMMMTGLDDGECRDCGSERVFFGLKEEASGWKVHVDCDECCAEAMVGRVKMSDVDHADEKYEQAEDLARSYLD